MKILKKITGLLMAVVMAVTAMPLTASAAVAVPDNEATRFVDSLGAIWNLGNAFDAVDCTWLSNELDYESGWCGAKTTEKLVKEIKNMGFGTIRIPVSWHNHIDSGYNISSAWIDRVQEVVDWSLDAGLYVILNVHHDVEKEYYYPDSAHYENSEKYMTKVWSQISEKFSDTDDRLIFEIINEPRLKGDNNEWWFTFNNPEAVVKDSIECINKLNQASLDVIRKAGGKNKDRFILVGGYCTSADGVTTETFELPKDSVKNRIIVDYHHYTKSAAENKRFINRIYDTYVSKGIPAILSEYNLDPGPNKYDDNSAKYLGEWVAYAREHGISCAIWDNNDVAYKLIDRATVKWTQEEIAESIVKAGAPAMKSSASSSTPPSSDSDKKTSAINVKAKQDGFYVYISWNKVDGASKYRVYRSKSVNGSKTRIAQTTHISCTNRNSDIGGTYYYYVKSYDKKTGKWSDYSEPAKLSVTKSKAVTKLSGKKNGSKVTLTWESIGGVAKYQIFYSTDGKSYKRLATVNGTRSSINVSGLNFDKYDYKFAVRAVDSDGNKANLSNKVTIK